MKPTPRTVSRYLDADLASGIAARIVGVRVVDGVTGWARVVLRNGDVWDYAPDDYARTVGEIAREVAL